MLADAIIEQETRRARGWDQGRYRDDDTTRGETIEQAMRLNASDAFNLACAHRDPVK